MPRPFVLAAVAALAAVAQAASATTNADFVRQMCIDILHHPGSAAEMGALTNSLNQAAVTRQQAALSLINSAHGRAAHIDDVYRRFLGRSADTAAITAFTAALAQGETYDGVNAVILGSAEYFTRAGATNAAFLNQLFLDLLNRPVDPGSQAAFLPLLNGGTPRSTIATSVLTSLEYDRGCVIGWYNAFLHRTANPTETSSFANLLQTSTRDETVISNILGSLEYFNLVPTPCIGDINGDRRVDFADLNAVLSQFGQSGPALSADLDGDGAVTFADLNVVLSAYGNNC